MRHTSILTSILILILHSYDIKAQNGKLYDVEGLLLIEHIYMRMGYISLYGIQREGKPILLVILYLIILPVCFLQSKLMRIF